MCCAPTGCLERVYLNGRLKDLGSGQQHKVAPGCGGEETVRDQGQRGMQGVIIAAEGEGPLISGGPRVTQRPGGPAMDEQDCPHNTSIANEIQVKIKDCVLKYFLFV